MYISTFVTEAKALTLIAHVNLTKSIFAVLVGLARVGPGMGRSGGMTNAGMTRSTPITEGGPLFASVSHASTPGTMLRLRTGINLGELTTKCVTRKRISTFSTDARGRPFAAYIGGADTAYAVLVCLTGVGLNLRSAARVALIGVPSWTALTIMLTGRADAGQAGSRLTKLTRATFFNKRRTGAVVATSMNTTAYATLTIKRPL